MRKYCLRSIYILLTLTTLGLSSTLHASSHGNIFIPYYFTPLSSFLKKDSTITETLRFTVHTDVLNYILSNQFPGAIAHLDSTNTINFIAPTAVDVSNGAITLDTNLTGKFVFIAEPFTNDLDIVTHWQQSLNNGKGGFTEGARDALGLIDFQPSTNQFNITWDIYNIDPANPYTYDTDRFALFSSDPHMPKAKVPSIDRYVGENYAIQKITANYALHMAVSVVESTGYPLIHKNHPWAFDHTAQTHQRLQQNIPAFQILHNTVIAYEADKASLATFILPPSWNANPVIKYPVLFNGLYDINFNTAVVNGLPFIQVIHELMQEGEESTVGILWNGGGSRGPITLQPSAYVNGAFLFEYASILLGIDKTRMVFAGVSRGGMTALNMAANPYFENYTPTHVVSYVPATKLGEHTKWIGPNYPGLYSVSAWSTGYKYAYQNGWLDPETGYNEKQLLNYNFFGYADEASANYLSPTSDLFLDELKNADVHINILVGTHDSFMPFNLHLEYKNRLDAKGIRNQMHVGARFGHSISVDDTGMLKQALRESMHGVKPASTSTIFYQRQAETGEGYNTPIAISDGSIPFFSELPKAAYPGLSTRIVVGGDKDATYLVAYYKIDDTKWQVGQVELASDPVVMAYGVFNATESFQAQGTDYTFPHNTTPGFYVYVTLRLAPGSTSWELIDPLKVTHPVDGDPGNPPIAVFEIKTQAFTAPALELNSTYNIKDRGWGNSSH